MEELKSVNVKRRVYKEKMIKPYYLSLKVSQLKKVFYLSPFNV